jgi:hypothetical protein
MKKVVLFVIAGFLAGSLVSVVLVSYPVNSQEQGEKVVLRSEPKTVSSEEAQKVFKLKGWGPLEYIQNDFKDQGEVVVDHATGLMWQKSGSDKHLTYKKAQAYIKKLNDEQFAGYDDWRLPTIPELMSLLEDRIQSSNGLYINPIFDSTQIYCWSADIRIKGEGSLGSAWRVDFLIGLVFWRYLDDDYSVRGVRSRQN